MDGLSSLFRKGFLVVAALCVAGLASGCDLGKNQLKVDRASNMEFQDFRDGLAPRESSMADETGGNLSGVPALEPYVADASEALRPMPLVSVSVNQTVPLRDVLYQLAEQASYDLELDPRIRGSIIFSAKEKPLDTVVDRICKMAGLRYTLDDDVLRVELDTPYNKTYKIDYLSYVRKNESAVQNDIGVVTGEGANTGSSFKMDSQGEADFWKELETNLTQILGSSTAVATLRSSNDPQVSVVESLAPVEPVQSGGSGAPGEAVVQVSTLPTLEEEPFDEEALAATFSVNRQAGMVSVYATERQQEEIQAYLQELKRSVTAQVLIEAKILEVSLSDEYAAGIDWGKLSDSNFVFDINSGVNGALAVTRPTFDPNPISNPATNFRIGYVGNNFAAMVDAVSRFGTVRALASPRLTVLNNQSAALTVAENRVYFEVDIEVTEASSNGPGSTTIESNIQSVPEGVLVNVQPSINLDSREISMAVRPTITRIDEFIEDPGVQFVTAQANIDGVQSLVPIVIVQEMDSVINMPSGQAVVMGGLMQDRAETTEHGVPVLSEVPLFGNLFKNHKDSIQKTELVIFLKATIVDGSNVHDTDRQLYKTFSGDRRPLSF
ncbi:MAG: type II and III secretion system family protein [Alphaproteobacteria bacterium]|nr:type II and III secretion system family protein [Alphaproteobacteria bacterium]